MAREVLSEVSHELNKLIDAGIALGFHEAGWINVNKR